MITFRKYFTAFLLLISVTAYTQRYEDAYQQPLKDVLKEIESRFGVTFQYREDDIKNRVVKYAGWRFRSDLESTLNNILIPQELVRYKLPGNVYHIEGFAYWQQSVEDGQKQLSHLSSLYNDAVQWESRKAGLKDCILKTLGLTILPALPSSKPIVTAKRQMDGYTVENFALETLPGLFVCGSVYRPAKSKGKLPIVLCPNGHFGGGRYRADQQYRCAGLARMGAIAISYDMIGWGESRLQVKEEDHRTSTAMVVQVLNSIRIIGYACGLKYADSSRIAITGASGGASQSMLLTALDERIKVSVPVVMLSCYYAGGCPCETGLPILFCGKGSSNAEIAAMAAPRPQLVVSDGKDWTDHVPEIEFPFLQRIYGFYNKRSSVKNVHLPNDGHDYGLSKRKPVYAFLADQFHLNIKAITNTAGEIDESHCTIENEEALFVFGRNGELLPAHAIKNIEELRRQVDASLVK